MVSAFKVILFALFYATVDSSPVMVEGPDLIEIEQELKVEIKEAVEAAPAKEEK